MPRTKASAKAKKATLLKKKRPTAKKLSKISKKRGPKKLQPSEQRKKCLQFQKGFIL